jgi:hypothetical protein
MDLIYSSRPKGTRVVFANINITEGFLRFLLTESFASRIINMLNVTNVKNTQNIRVMVRKH